MAYLQQNDTVHNNTLTFSTITTIRLLTKLKHWHIVLASICFLTQYTLPAIMVTAAAAAAPNAYATHLTQDTRDTLIDVDNHRQHILFNHNNPDHHYSALKDAYNNHNHHHQHRRRLQRDSSAKDDVSVHNVNHCNDVKGYFESIDIQLPEQFNEKGGSICKGQCCTNSTEIELRKKATIEFERLLHHHTKSLRGILEKTTNIFQSHILELTQQSENRTLNVFSQVYWRMEPLSRKLIIQLYTEIISHLKGSENRNSNTLEEGIHKFFAHLFPLAYHQAVHLSKNNYGELHEDYINCLKHTFDDLQPFGNIPKELARSLMHSVQTARIFMNALQQSAEVLSETDELYASHLSSSCQRHLLKMSYCPSCNGLRKVHVKPCYSYCMNVLRGCSAQYAGVLDSPWSNVVDAIDNLVTSHIRSDNGIVPVIKQLDSKLSEAIMLAMEHGPELENKVKKTCGTPKLLPSLTMKAEGKPNTQHNVKWASPVDSEILRFLSTIDKSKEFYSNIVNTVCEDDDIQRNDHHCWTGDRIGDYTQLVMTTGIDTQRYNPEVPLQPNAQSNKFNELVDKLLKVRKNIATAIPSASRTINEIQNDMAGHDDEGSGRMTDDVDDDEYNNLQESSGSGDGSTPAPFDLRPDVKENVIEDSSKASSCKTHLTYSVNMSMAILVLLVKHFVTCRL